MQYRPDIDGLRAVAVIPVILYHAGIGFPGGFIGVDVFFVISGFLITGIISEEMHDRRFSLVKFYARRAKRLLPALFTVLFLTSIAAIALMVPDDLADYGKSLIATVTFAANIYFFRQEGYFTEAAELKPLLHMWSLGVEEQYYIIFPVVLLALIRLLPARWVIISVAAFILTSLIGAMSALPLKPEAAFYLPHLRAWELLVGSLISLLRPTCARASARLPQQFSTVLSLLGLASILSSAIFYSTETPFPAESALLPCMGAALIIATGGHGETIISRLLSNGPIVAVGKLSYSLYLWHWPIIAFTYYATGEINLIEGLTCLAATFTLAYLTYKFIEQPVRIRPHIGHGKVLLRSSIVISTFLLMGTILWQTDGIPSRFPELTLLSDDSKYLHDRRDCHFVTAERLTNGDICLRGSDGVLASFVLIGDSHADAFSPALFSAAKRLGLASYQVTDAGFRPLPGVRPLRGDADKRIDALFKFLDGHPSVRALIISGYWEHQMTGYTYRHSGDVWVDDGYDGSGSKYNHLATINGLARLAARFPDRQIVLLDDVPSGKALHLRDQLRRLRFDRDAVLTMPRADYEIQRAVYVPALVELAERIENLHYRTVFDSLCGSDSCPLFDGKVLLFRDGDHLSHEGALRLTSGAESLLKNLP